MSRTGGRQRHGRSLDSSDLVHFAWYSVPITEIIWFSGRTEMKRAAAVISILLVVNSFAIAQSQATLSACTQVHSTLLTEGGHGGLAGSAGCGTPGCNSSGTLLPSWNVTCPLPAGGVCTLALQPTFNYSASAGDFTTVYPIVAGKVGPFLNDNDDFVLPSGSGVATFTFIEQVKNTTANQAHNVQMWLACFDNTGDGCFVSTGGGMYTRAATLRIDVLTGCYSQIAP